jgi:superfamily II DNA/RNA helicase
MLDLIREQLDQTGIDYAVHTGKVPQNRRRQALNRFKADPACRILLSSDAGATGLNLQAANVVINVDLPWNPARLEQRIVRAWRKHQQRNVTVINLVCEDSIEHRILHLLDEKRSLAEGVVEGTGEAEMPLPSGRKMLVERLESLMGARLANQQVTEPETQPAPLALDDLPQELEARQPQSLESMAIYEAGDGRQTLLAVVGGDVDRRRGELEAAVGRTDARPDVETIDGGTMAVIQRLVDAGVLTMKAPQQTLHGSPKSAARDDTEERRRRVDAARKRLTTAERKLGMARVLADGGFTEEIAAPMTEALEEALGALADSAGDDVATPVPLAHVHAVLAPRAGLDDDTLALLAILREDSAAAPASAFDTVTAALERIGTAVERQALA